LECRKSDAPSCGHLHIGRLPFSWFGTIRVFQKRWFDLRVRSSIFGLETRSFLHRIAFRFGTPCHSQGIELGRVYHPNENQPLEVCIRRRDCIRDIENFAALNPTATIIDWDHFREGWEAGPKWGARNSCSCTSESSALP